MHQDMRTPLVVFPLSYRVGQTTLPSIFAGISAMASSIASFRVSRVRDRTLCRYLRFDVSPQKSHTGSNGGKERGMEHPTSKKKITRIMMGSRAVVSFCLYRVFRHTLLFWDAKKVSSISQQRAEITITSYGCRKIRPNIAYRGHSAV